MINLLKGDCLELLKEIPDKSIDFVLTDPPYGTTACKWDVVIPFEPMWKELKRITKDNGAIALFGSEPFSSFLRTSNIDMFKYDWVWIKDKPSNFMMGKKQPLRYSEFVHIFGHKIPYYPQMQPREKANKRRNKVTSSLLKNENIGINERTDKYQDRLLSGTNDYIYPRNYQHFPNRTEGLHPTQKPVALLEYLIKTYTLEGETVLDFTMGSCSTGVAAKNLNRNFIGIEKDDKYFEIAKNRIEDVE